MGCSAGQTAEPTPGRKANGRGGAEERPAPEAKAPSPVTSKSDGAADSSAVGPARPHLVIPVDPAFLTRRLPPRVPDRYASWHETVRIDVGQGYLTEVDRLPSGHWLALSQADGQVRVYEPRSRRLVARHAVTGFREFERTALSAFPAGHDRYVLGTSQGLRAFDAATGAELQVVDERPVWRLRWSADQRVLMALGSGTTEQTSVLRFYELESDGVLAALGELSFEERVDAWDLSPDGRLLVIASYPSNALSVLDLADDGRMIHSRAAPRYAGDVAFSPDGRFLAAAGDGLLVVDLINPERVGFYSHVKNNMGHVRFSPSSDAVVASSYDGKIRVIGIDMNENGQLALTLRKELSHAGTANVYAFAFSADGRELVSASGDRTLRAFAGRVGSGPTDPGAVPPNPASVFHDVATWRSLEPAALRPLGPSSESPAGTPLSLPSERGPVRPASVAPGRYACKITLIYKLRPCWVRKDAEGRTLLEFSPDNLLHIGGVLWDDGSALRFEGKLLTPSTVLDCAGCERQALHAVFRGQRGKYTGLLTFRQYYDPFVPPAPPPLDVRIEEANDRFPLVLEFVGPSDTPSSVE